MNAKRVLQAGMVTTLNARTSVLAAMNPVGTYDSRKSIHANTALAVPLISRFDVIMVLLDSKETARDADIADTILKLKPGAKDPSGKPSQTSSDSPPGIASQHSTQTNRTPAGPRRAQTGEKVARAHEARTSGGSAQPGIGEQSREQSGNGSKGELSWDIDMMRQYIGWVKQTFQPTMSTDAQEILMAYYTWQRQAVNLTMGADSRVTVRTLESLARLSQVRSIPSPPRSHASYHTYNCNRLIPCRDVCRLVIQTDIQTFWCSCGLGAYISYQHLVLEFIRLCVQPCKTCVCLFFDLELVLVSMVMVVPYRP